MEVTQQPPDGSGVPQPTVDQPPHDSRERPVARSGDGYIDISGLVSQVRRTSPLREIAEGILGNTARPDTPALPLFSALAGASERSWRERVVAAWALSRVELDGQERDAAAEMLLDALEQDPEQTLWERFLHGLLWGYGAMLPVCLVGSLIICRSQPAYEWSDIFPQMLFMLGSLASVLTIPMCVIYGRLTSDHAELIQAAAAESLGRLRVVESIGPLADRLFDPSASIRDAAAFALMEILPNLSDAECAAIDSEAISRLGDALCHPNTLLVYKILEALNRIGGGRSLPAVERLSREGRTRRLQDAARQVATVLEERRRREREAMHLMRPTATDDPRVASMVGVRSTDSTADNLLKLRNGVAPTDWQ
ncbi:MAG TPA: hypothetical protein VKT77_09160 [Chthonomonadaceae bacterium]|nr:hypothetical protein [Chthonomonadaceae bacterium]